MVSGQEPGDPVSNPHFTLRGGEQAEWCPPKVCPYPNLWILKCDLIWQTSNYYLYGKRS